MLLWAAMRTTRALYVIAGVFLLLSMLKSPAPTVFSWDNNPETNISHYVLTISTNNFIGSGEPWTPEYWHIAVTNQNCAGVTDWSATDMGFAYITAVNTYGLSSDRSRYVAFTSATILEEPVPFSRSFTRSNIIMRAEAEGGWHYYLSESYGRGNTPAPPCYPQETVSSFHFSRVFEGNYLGMPSTNATLVVTVPLAPGGTRFWRLMRGQGFPSALALMPTEKAEWLPSGNSGGGSPEPEEPVTLTPEQIEQVKAMKEAAGTSNVKPPSPN